MKTIFLFIPNYVYTSDLLKTGYIKKLGERFRVIVFLPVGALGAGSYPELPNVSYREWALEFPAFWERMNEFGRIPLIRKFDYEPVIQRHYRSNPFWKSRKARAIRLLGRLLPAAFLTPDFFTRLESGFLPHSARFEALVRKEQPAALLTPTPGFSHFEAEAMHLAWQNRLPAIAVDFSWDKLHSGGKQIRKSDFLIVWNKIIADEAVSVHGFPPERVFISGIIRFDNYFASGSGRLSREAFLHSKGLDPAEKTILLTTVTKGNYTEEQERIRELLEARDRGSFPGFPNFFIRLHPKDDPALYREFEGFRNVRIEAAGKVMPIALGVPVEIDAEDMENLKNTLQHCDAILNYASTISLEACIFDKPIVNFGYPPEFMNAYSFAHYKPLVEWGAVRVAKSADELIQAINDGFRDPGREREARARVVRELVGHADGKSAERSVELLEKLVRNEEKRKEK